MSDVLTVDENIGGRRLLYDNQTSGQNQIYFGNHVTKSCHSISGSPDSQVSCVEHNYWYGVLTLVFIFAPSANVLVALLGPRTGGTFGAVWGGVMVILGLVLVIQVANGDATLNIFGWILIFLGVIMVGIGLNNRASVQQWLTIPEAKGELSRNWMFLFVVPFIIAISPLIMMLIITLAILRPNSKFIQNQKKVCKFGEATLEATPQLCLQLYIIMKSLTFSWIPIFSIATSALSLPISNVEKYLETRDLELKLNLDSFQIYIVLFFNSFFRILVNSICFVFLEILTAVVLFVYMIFWIVCDYFTVSHVTGGIPKLQFSKLRWKALKGRSKYTNSLETYIFSFLTITDIGRTQLSFRTRLHPSIIRLVSTYYNFIFSTILLIVIVTTCNTNLNAVEIPMGGSKGSFHDIIWSELKIVQHIFYLNVIIGVTLFIGLSSLLLDLLLARCNSFVDNEWNWNAAVLHEGLCDFEFPS